MNKIKKVILITLLLLIIFPNITTAAHSDFDLGNLVLFKNIKFDNNNSYGNITVAGGSADIKTNIQGSVVVIFGKAVIDGNISEDVVSILGEVEIKSGTQIGGNLVSIGRLEKEEDVDIKGTKLNINVDYISIFKSNNIIINTLIFFTILVLAVGLILISIFSGRYRVMSYTMECGIKRILILGALVVISFTIVLAFLAFLLVVPVIYVVMLMFAEIIASIYVGHFIIKSKYERSAVYLDFFVGQIVISIFKIVPLIIIPAGSYRLLMIYGICYIILQLCMAALGMGTVIESRFGNKNTKCMKNGKV